MKQTTLILALCLVLATVVNSESDAENNDSFQLLEELKRDSAARCMMDEDNCAEKGGAEVAECVDNGRGFKCACKAIAPYSSLLKKCATAEEVDAFKKCMTDSNDCAKLGGKSVAECKKLSYGFRCRCKNETEAYSMSLQQCVNKEAHQMVCTFKEFGLALADGKMQMEPCVKCYCDKKKKKEGEEIGETLGYRTLCDVQTADQCSFMG